MVMWVLGQCRRMRPIRRLSSLRTSTPDGVLPGRVHRVFYERMVDGTEGQVRALLDYCGLDFEAGCLEFYKTDRAVRTASSEQVRQPIYRDATEEWRPYERYLAPLKDALGAALDAYPAT